MSYDQGEMVCRCQAAGDSGIKLWTYKTTDNLASSTAGLLMTNYFKNSFADTPNLATGDIILAVNGATPVVSVFVVKDADANNVTVVGSAGMEKQLKT